MSKKKHSKVTIANIVTMLGLVALTFFVFCGQALQNYENNMGTNIIVALAFVLGTSFVLWLMIHAKTVENNFRNWRIVEVFAILLFFAVSFFSATRMMKFFVINEKMETLKEAALEDVNKLNTLMNDFQVKENRRLQLCETGYETALSGNYTISREINSYKNHVDSNGGAEEYFEKLNRKILKIEENGSAKAYKAVWDKEIKELEETIVNWNLVLLPQAVKQLEVLSREINENLTKVSADYGFKEFVDCNDGSLDIKDSESCVYKYNVEFPSMVKDSEGFSAMGLLVIIFIYILVLASYIFAYRSRKVAPKSKGTFLGGAPLN